MTQTIEEQKKWIDNATLFQLLEKWRFAASGDPMFTGEVGDYYSEVMFKKREADPTEWVRCSKAL